MSRRGRRGLAMLAPLALLAGAATAADPVGAERQYRIARRLAAEGSPDAAEALRKVIELDPDGVLADDALLEEALLQPVPRWPEDLGRIDAAQAARALELTRRVVDEHGRGDRASEARYYRGLLLLESLPQHDASAARVDLLTAATTPEAGAWADAARYAVAWLAEQQSGPARALASYQRLLVDAPGGPAALRARVGLARLHLRDGRYGSAARLLHVAARRMEGDKHGVEALRELAVRLLLHETDSPEVQVVAASTGVRDLAGLAVDPAGGGVVLADRRSGSVQLLGPTGEVRSRWTLSELHAVAVSPLGRAFVAAGDQVYRLDQEQPPVPVAAQGVFSPPAGMTVDGLGGIWLLDRRGAAVGRIEPGATVPVKVWEGSGVKLVDIRWDGSRLLAVDGKSKSLVALSADSEREFLAGRNLQRPVAVAVDPAGRLAVLDVKAGAIAFFDRSGGPIHRFDYRSAGIKNPGALDFGLDGSLHLFDGASAAWMRLQ